MPKHPRAALCKSEAAHLAVALGLVGRQDDDAGQVVAVVGELLFAEEAEDVIPTRLPVGQDVEEEAVDVEEHVLVLDEEPCGRQRSEISLSTHLAEQGQILTPQLQPVSRGTSTRSHTFAEAPSTSQMVLAPRW